MFRTGQKVTCVDASPCPAWGQLTLVEGEVYTVLCTGASWIHLPEGGIGMGGVVELVENKSPHPARMYKACRFRPVVEKKTDISVFSKMLITKRKRQNA